jgi:hypothetical protein
MNDSVDSLLCGQIEYWRECIGGTVDLPTADPRDGQHGVRTGSVTECPVRIRRVRIRLNSLMGVVFSH